MISTGMWGDPRVAALSAEAKLLFVRLFSGDDTTTAGATRATTARLAADLALPPERTEAALGELVASGLLRAYAEGWYWLPSFVRWQLSGPGFIGGARRVAREVPDSLGRAITRALDELVGVRGSLPADAPRPDKGRTRKGPNSRKEGGRTGGSDPPSDPSGHDDEPLPTGKGPDSREEVGRTGGRTGERGQDQDQDQDQDGPSVRQSWSVDNAPASPAPAPGAPASAGAGGREGEPPPPASTPGVSAAASRNEELDGEGVSRADRRALDAYRTTREAGFIAHLLTDSPFESDAAKRAARALLEELPPAGGERGG